MSNEIIVESGPLSADASVHAAPDSAGSPSSRADSARPLPADALIIVPVRKAVLFPGVVLPLTVGRERSRAAAQEAARLERPLGVLLQSNPDVELPGPDDLQRKRRSSGSNALGMLGGN